MSETPNNRDVVLVVDDDKDIRETIAELLEEHGYGVAQAANGVDALLYLRHAPAPCVIILDLMMPFMDGMTFRSEQLQDASIADVPVIVLSADVAAKEKARHLNAFEGLRKPVGIDVLLSAVNRVCHRYEGGTTETVA